MQALHCSTHVGYAHQQPGWCRCCCCLQLPQASKQPPPRQGKSKRPRSAGHESEGEESDAEAGQGEAEGEEETAEGQAGAEAAEDDGQAGKGTDHESFAAELRRKRAMRQSQGAGFVAFIPAQLSAVSYGAMVWLVVYGIASMGCSIALPSAHSLHKQRPSCAGFVMLRYSCSF